MKIGRKEALLALVATMVPWIGRRANAQVPREQLRDPVSMRVQQSPEVVDLQKRVAALEAQLASQVGFTRDAYGNLLLKSGQNVTIEAGVNFTAKASNMLSLRGNNAGELTSGGSTIIRGASLGLN